MGRATSGVSGMKFRTKDDAVLSMSVIRAAQIAVEDADESDVEEAGDKVQYVFTITDGGFAKRSRISDYRTTNRGGLGVRAMALTNEDRGGLVGGFIVEDGDEVLSITQNGQVVRSPINEDFRPTGRSTMGVKFVTPKEGDAVAVVARSVEAKVVDEVTDAEAAEDAPETAGDDQTTTTDETEVSPDLGPDVTIEESAAGSNEPEANDPGDQGDSEG
jgi:DNA gyrase subunit A